MPYGARRGRCAFRHSIWQAASSRSATSRLFITAVIRASRRSPSPRGGRRNHRAAGRPEIARACGRPRAPPSSSMPASSPAAASRSRSTARPVSDRPPLRRQCARRGGADHRIRPRLGRQPRGTWYRGYQTHAPGISLETRRSRSPRPVAFGSKLGSGRSARLPRRPVERGPVLRSGSG